MQSLPAFNRRFVLKSRPVDLPERDNFEIEQVDHPELGDGDVRVRVEYVALSPWQGQRLKDFRNYTKPFEIGDIIDCDVLGQIIEAGADVPDTHAVGQLVTARLGWQEYAVAKPEQLMPVSNEFTSTLWLTALSSPGLTAYCAMDLLGRPMPGQTLVVTSAAGSVGSFAVQLGKLAGMHVVGVAGGTEKCRHVVANLGADACIDHRSDTYASDLGAALGDGAHLVFDTVGGRIADAVFDNIAMYAKVLIVGRTASNNSDRPGLDPVNMRQLWAREATVQGFSRYSYPERWSFARERMQVLCRRGVIQSQHNEVAGFEATPDALRGMLSGEFTGKVLVHYAGEREENHS
ncbi:MAG: NADP-dependent oxidoreductase [Hyphomicrobiaceae bacterium]